MKMEMNGQKSCSDRSRHIHIKYFFVNDVNLKKYIIIEHCGTDDMIADYFTKPLQGSLFIKMRAILMGLFHSTIKERVGENLISSNGFLTETIAEFPMTKIERIINNDEGKKEEE